MAIIEAPATGDRPADRPSPGTAGAVDALIQTRERIADFLSRPAIPTLRAMIDSAQRFLSLESRLVLTTAGDLGFTEQQQAALDASHRELVALLNAMVWEVPGSADLAERTLAFRHTLLRHLDLYTPVRRSTRP